MSSSAATLTNHNHALPSHPPSLEESPLLQRLFEKVEAIERKLDALEVVTNQAPGMVSMVADTVDDLLANQRRAGVDVEERLKQGVILLEQLTQPPVLQALSGLVANLTVMEGLVQQAPGMVSMMADTADDLYAGMAGAGIDVEQRLQQGLILLERLTQPAVMQTLNRLLDNLGVVESMITQGPGLAAMMADTIDEMYVSAQRSGIDLEATARNGLSAAQTLLASGVLEPAAVSLVGKLAEALPRNHRQIQPVGIIGMMRAFANPDVQRAAGFLMAFAQNLGKSLPQ